MAVIKTSGSTFLPLRPFRLPLSLLGVLCCLLFQPDSPFLQRGRIHGRISSPRLISSVKFSIISLCFIEAQRYACALPVLKPGGGGGYFGRSPPAKGRRVARGQYHNKADTFCSGARHAGGSADHSGSSRIRSDRSMRQGERNMRCDTVNFTQNQLTSNTGKKHDIICLSWTPPPHPPSNSMHLKTRLK